MPLGAKTAVIQYLCSSDINFWQINLKTELRPKNSALQLRHVRCNRYISPRKIAIPSSVQSFSVVHLSRTVPSRLDNLSA